MRCGALRAALTTRLVSTMSTLSRTDMEGSLRRLVPPLTLTAHKGQAGRIGVVGGSSDYTGAPYFAAISALRVGSDLSYVLTADTASQVIKGYDPELMVTPVYHTDWQEEEGQASQGAAAMARAVVSYFSRVHCLVVGPGLGRHTMMAEAMKLVLACAREDNLPVVIDADGLFHVAQHPDIVRGNSRVTLTPNVMEFVRLWGAVGLEEAALPKQGGSAWEPATEHVRQLAHALGDVTVVLKGAQDHISDGTDAVTCALAGGLKRCGGLGDVLSGALGTFTAWGALLEGRQEQAQQEQGQEGGSSSAEDKAPTGSTIRGVHVSDRLAAAWWACAVARMASRQAYNKAGRSMGAAHAIAELGTIMEHLVPSPQVAGD